jgi:hypothetical protein
MLVFSSLGMGPDYFEGRVVSAANRDGAAMARARAFRPAEVPRDLGSGWYGRSYVSGNTQAADPVRHQAKRLLGRFSFWRSTPTFSAAEF